MVNTINIKEFFVWDDDLPVCGDDLLGILK